MSLLQKLVESYDHMADKYAGLYIDTMREPLAPISHTLQNAQIEITINDEGEFVEAALISKKEGRTLIPVTLKSANRTIKKVRILSRNSWNFCLDLILIYRSLILDS